MLAALFKIVEWLAKGGVAAFFVQAGLTLTIFTGLELLLNEQLNTIAQHMGGMAGPALQLALLSGVGQFINIIGGALLTRAAILMATQSLGITKAST